MTLERLAGIVVKSLDDVLVKVKSRWSVVSRRVINSDLCLIKNITLAAVQRTEYWRKDGKNRRKEIGWQPSPYSTPRMARKSLG